MAKIKVQNTEITIVSHNDDDYISLTDMASQSVAGTHYFPMAQSEKYD